MKTEEDLMDEMLIKDEISPDEYVDWVNYKMRKKSEWYMEHEPPGERRGSDG